MRRSAQLLLVGFVSARSFCALAAEPAGERLLAFANRGELSLFVGKWNPRHGWVQAADFYTPPEPGSPVTLFQTGGRVGETVITDNRRADPRWTPRDWSAHISTWSWRNNPYALAVAGRWPESSVPPKQISLVDEDVRSAVRDLLKKKGLTVPEPVVTQAFEMTENGRTTRWICAHSDPAAEKEGAAATIYDVALVEVRSSGLSAVTPLAVHASFKPAERTLDEHHRLYGLREYYRWLAFEDLNGDGRAEAVLYRALPRATEVDIYTWRAGRLEEALTAYSPF